MMEKLLGLGTIVLGIFAIFTILLAVGFFFHSNTGPAILTLAFWCFIAYHIGMAIIANI